MSVALNTQLGPKQKLGKCPGHSAGNHTLLRNINVTLLRPQHRQTASQRWLPRTPSFLTNGPVLAFRHNLSLLERPSQQETQEHCH